MKMHPGTLFALLSFLVISLLPACKNQKSASSGPERPYQPWVFRSVLDQQPRILTLALHDDLWAAYHTDSCSLYKVWKGHVHLQGAVYDNAHGPQPISLGNGWIENKFKQPWSVTKGGQQILKDVRYGGHIIKNGHASLVYHLNLTDGETITVHESPEMISKDGGIGFERIFSLQNATKDHEVSLLQNVNSIALQKNIETNGKWEVTAETKSEQNGKQLLAVDGKLILNSEGETFFRTHFINQPAINNPNSIGKEEAAMSLGERLIAKNDCKTCHNAKVQTIGPAYKHIAERYPMRDEEIVRLANKIIAGGAGIWGTQVMSAHPELPVSDAQEMVRYILSLDTTDAGQQGDALTVTTLTTELTDVKNVLPGLYTDVYMNQTGFEKLPNYPANKKSDEAGILTDFYSLDVTDFGGLTEDFVLIAKGYLFTPSDTVTGLRVISDDGSRVTIDAHVILDNDGLHGAEMKETNVRLSKGYHPVTIEYMNGKGGRYLSFEWKPEGAADWSEIPLGTLVHEASWHDKMQGKKFSMVTTRKIPGDQAPLESVHPSYDLTQARPYDFLPKVGGMDFLKDGRLAVSTWDPSGAVYLLSDVQSGDPNKIKVKQIASGLAEPLGLKVINDTIYVLQKQELTRLIDVNGDDIIDEYQCVTNNWPTSANFHEFAFGLAEKQGDLYATLAIAILPGGASAPNQMATRGRVVRFDLPSGDIHYIASGLRTPNGIGVGIDDQIFVADNQGDWLPSSKILQVNQDDWFGSRAVDWEGTATLKEKPPVVWLPQDEIGNSPSTPLAINDGPYKGQMIHSEVTQGGVQRVFVEKINDVYQGVVFRFIQGLEAGINRMTWGPDGALYVGGIGNPGNWAQPDKLWYGLQRLKYNGKPTFEMLAVRAKSDGVEIEFTEPLRERDGWDVSDWEVRQWRYVPTKDYGGPKVDNGALKVEGAYVSADRKKVSLKLQGMKAGHVVYIHMKDRYISEAGRALWTTEAWYTMNNIPANNPVTTSSVPVLAENSLTPAEASNGWKLLFDGKSTTGWRNYNKTTIGTGWIVENGALTLDAKKNPDGHWQAQDGGDIVTNEEFENYELELEWKIAPCGNSGIIYNVVEDPKYNYVWETGPEMQVLDNVCHPDARYTTHKAGDLYDLIESSFVTVKPSGEWNKARIIQQNGKVEHWLNGVKVVEFDINSNQYQALIAKSKFKDMPAFGKATKGRIALQDHGDRVSYRNIRIKNLQPQG